MKMKNINTCETHINPIVPMLSSLAFAQLSGLQILPVSPTNKLKTAYLKASPREKNYTAFVKSLFIKLIGDIKMTEIIYHLSSVHSHK